MSKLFGKGETRLSARVTSEEDWQTDVPNIRLSRAFVIVLLMHLVVGGALVAFTLMNPSEAKAQAGGDKQAKQPEKVADAGKPEEEETPAERPSASSLSAADRTDDMRRHIVHSGDSVAKIARQYGVTSEEIHAVNRIDELYQLYQGRVLRIPVSASQPIDLSPRLADKKPSSTSSNFVKTEEPRGAVAVPRIEAPGEVDIKAPTEVEKLDGSLVPETVESVRRPIVVEEIEVPQTRETQPAPAPAPAPAREVEPEPAREIVRPADVPEKPAPAASEKTYKVVKGDNPFRIAQRFGINYKELLRHNGITDPSKLQIGQTLRIPAQ